MISKPTAQPSDLRGIEKTSTIGDTGSPETPPDGTPKWQESGNEGRLTELEAAIANVTRLLGKTDDAETAAALVAERRAMREELRARRLARMGNVVALPPRPRKRGE